MLCYTVNEILELWLEGVSNILMKTLYVQVVPELSIWRGGRCWGGGIPSLQGSLRGCRVLLPVGCSTGLGASVVVELSEGGNMTQRDFTSSYTIQWGWTPVKPKVRVVPACVRSLRGCA